MKNTIYYFSGTGNSLYVAKKIQEKLGDTELVHITAELRDRSVSIETDVLGFVFPVYAWGPPVIVAEFIKHINVRKSGYIFVVATNAGGPENTLKRVEKLLKNKGLATDSAFSITMPANYILGMNPPLQEESQKIINAADSKLSEMLTAIAEKRPTAVPGATTLLGMIKSTLGHSGFAMMMNKQDKKFFSSNKCTGCGICEKLCPAENIRLNTEKKPVWQHHCELCLACINWCPEHAIEAGEATAQRNRYHHPEIKVSELTRK